MIRALLTTTALAALLSTAALAQEAPANNTMAPAGETAPANNSMAPANEMEPANNTMAPATDTAPANNTMAPANEMEPADAASDDSMSAEMSMSYTPVEGDTLASELIGTVVYSTEAEDAETIGEVNDVVIAASGNVSAVVIGVGGFLGMGEKNVAVGWNDLNWVMQSDNTYRWILPTTADALTAAPDFIFTDENDAAMGTDADAAMAPVGGDPAVVETPDATATTAAPFDRSTMTDTTMTAEELIGTAVYGPNDEQIGSIGDFLLGEDGSTIDAVIIDVGGFLGMGVKEVAVGYDDLSFSADANNNRYLFLNTTAEQLEAQPEFNRDTYTTERDSQRMMTSM